ncbi:MAG TPA: sodium ion-translocating decarboxylase subunit beta, partial [Paludibacteraceae bacterium]|nr:sodium ion-translocating decarboxylase subunit beta [Paludibacteraceae bacterium]
MDISVLFPALASLTWQHILMILIGLTLIYLAIFKEYEPTLLLPIGFGTILVNIPLSSAINQIDGKTGEIIEGILSVFYEGGIATEMFPLLIFIAIGAMIDFTPLFNNPHLLLFGAAAQFGIFMTMFIATLF